MGQASSLELEFQAQPDRQAPTPNGSGQGPEEKTPEGRVFVVTGRGGPGEGAGLDAVGGSLLQKKPNCRAEPSLVGVLVNSSDSKLLYFYFKIGGWTKGRGELQGQGLATAPRQDCLVFIYVNSFIGKLQPPPWHL